MISYLFNKIFEHILAKLNAENQIRYSRLYTDRIDPCRKTYSQIVNAERHLEELLRPVTLYPTKTREQIEEETVKSIIQFFNEYAENKILFEDASIEIIEYLKSNFHDAWGIYFRIEFFRGMKGSKDFSNAVKDARTTYETVIQKEIPKLKENLRADLRKQLKV